MRFATKWIDRLWLSLIALAFIIGAPLWIILWTERIWHLLTYLASLV